MEGCVVKIYRGKIVDFVGSWMSGLATLVIDDEERGRVKIPCDNAPTIRALESAFGGVIGGGHTAITEAIKGKEIFYYMDELGLVLGGFIPVESAPPEVFELYEKQKGVV